jgi:hypothetical protein
VGDRPEPDGAESPAEFVALMRQLRLWGDLSYRQLERNATDAGQVLPRATLSGALNRDELPRESLLAIYLQACGCDENTVVAWLTVRRRLAVSSERTCPPPTTPPAPDTAPSLFEAARVVPDTTLVTAETSSSRNSTPERIELKRGPTASEDTAAPKVGTRARQRWLLMTGLCAAAGVLAIVFWPNGGSSDDALDTPSRKASPSRRTSSFAPEAKPVPEEADAPALPVQGEAHIQPLVKPGMCLTEGRDRSGSTSRPIAAMQPCDYAASPDLYLIPGGRRTDDGIYWMEWFDKLNSHMGCLHVDSDKPGGYLTPKACGYAKTQEFRLEPSHGGFRLRSLHTDLCVGFRSPLKTGAEAIQAKCTGTKSQAFRIISIVPAPP